MKSPISICIPTYNGEKYLAECLDSVGAQTYTDFEALVVDDCSSDTTVEIASDYASRDKRFSVLCNEKNLGLVGNWNRCVELAEGEWIKFVFQDDLIAPTCLERMLQAGASGYPLVFCRRAFSFEEGTADEKKRFYTETSELVARFFPDSQPMAAARFAELAAKNMGRNFIGEPTAVMLHTSVFPQFGGFNPNLAVSCDKEYWIRVGINTGVAHVPDELAVFRVHGGSVTSRSMAEREYRMNVLDELAILHEAVFNPHYEPVRKAAQDMHLDLAAQFAERSLWAYGLAYRPAQDRSNPDGSLLREWNEVARHFCGFSSVPRRYKARRTWHAMVGRWRALWGLVTGSR